MKTIIETPRLLMRRITLDDAQDFFELDSDPDVVRYVGNKAPKNIEEIEIKLQNVLQQYIDNDIGRLVMIEKSTGDFIGWSGLQLEKTLRKEFSYYDLGYRLKKAFWGKGYATESAIATLKFGFETFGLREINACADVENIVSNYILKKVGMEYIEDFMYDGKLHHWYGISKT